MEQDITESIAFELAGGKGDAIRGKIELPKDRTGLPLIFILHGYKAFSGWGFFPYLSQRLALAGAIAVSYDFSRSGVSDPDKLLYNNELFSNNTVSLEIADAKIVYHEMIKRLQNDEQFAGRWNGEIYFAGHSLGGAISIMLASEFSEIKKTAAIAAISQFDRYSERQKELWLKRGVFEFKVNTTGQTLSMSADWVKDIIANSEKYNLEKAVNKIKNELMIVHGEQDITVGKAEAYRLAYAFENKSRLRFELIPKAGHGFGARHPFTKTNAEIEKLIDLLIGFFELKK